jgi:Transposase DDE domain
VQRERELDIVQLILALVLSGGTHEGGRQFDALRRYLESDAPRVVRGAFYGWFTAPLEALLMNLLGRAIPAGQAQPKLLPGILRGVHDWRIFDSTTVKVPNSPELQKEYPGTGEYAAIKIHKEFSVGTGNLVGYQFRPARDHDSPFLVVDEARRGTGLLIDLGYASLARLADYLYRVRWEIGASSKGRITQSVEVRPRPRDSRPRSVGGTVARKQNGEALRHHLERRCAKFQVAV